MSTPKNQFMKSFAGKNTISKKGGPADKKRPPTYLVLLPGFMIKKEIGLGDVISRATSEIGLKPCAACRKRAAALNKRLVFGKIKKT